jgi:hypothetical protein
MQTVRSKTISHRTVRALLALEDVEQKDVAEWIGTHPSSVTRRLQGQTRWTADEIAIVAERLGMPISLFFMAPDDITRMLGGKPMGRPRSGVTTQKGGSTTTVRTAHEVRRRVHRKGESLSERLSA